MDITLLCFYHAAHNFTEGKNSHGAEFSFLGKFGPVLGWLWTSFQLSNTLPTIFQRAILDFSTAKSDNA